MAGRLAGKVALVTGAARGQGRSHAVRLAEEGADVIALDACQDMRTVPYALGTADDLAQTVKLVEDLDRRIIARQADVRDMAAMQAVVDEGVAEFGRLDIVCGNAGVVSYVENAWDMTEDVWDETIDIDLSGVWKTCKAAIPAMIAAGNGGSIVLTSSTAGMKGFVQIAHYAAAKHGVVGLMRSLALELAKYSIRVNTVHPTGVNTPLVTNDFMQKWFTEHSEMLEALENPLPVEMIEPVDVSNAVVWLSSEEARYVTGAQIPVDAGFNQK